jgi:glycosyltransferase involved in cell wall biosynthesis
MRILHLSDSSLPDWRIEKAALTSKKNGHQVFFGGLLSSNYFNEIFDEMYVVPWVPNARYKFPFYWNMVKKQLDRAIKKIRPEIIHAHNIFSAKMVKDMGYDCMVYDNHEYWSVYVKRQLESYEQLKKIQTKDLSPIRRVIRDISRDYIKKRAFKMWSQWENEVVVDTPTITVSQSIVNELKKIGGKIFLVPNFPLFKEIELIEIPQRQESLSSVYAGVEAKGPIKPAHRNIDGFIDLFERNNIGKLFVIGWSDNSTTNVRYSGFLARRLMYEEMHNHSVGIIPFKKHWSHIYISPNKAYEYAHAGLCVMSTPGFVPVFENLGGNCISFNNYNDLIDLLSYYSSNLEELYSLRLKTYNYARNHLLWEKYEKNIIDSYKLC